MKKLFTFILSLSLASGLNGMFEGSNFEGATLTGSSLVGANFKNTRFVNANLSEADLRGTDLTNADLTNCVINTEPIVHLNTILLPTNFRGAIIEGINTKNLSPEVVQHIVSQSQKKINS